MYTFPVMSVNVIWWRHLTALCRKGFIEEKETNNVSSADNDSFYCHDLNIGLLDTLKGILLFLIQDSYGK